MRRFSALPAVVLLIAFCGCPPEGGDPDSSSIEPTISSGPLALVVIDDPSLSEAVRRAWKTRQAGEVQVRDMTRQELAEASRLEADVVIYPSGMMGELVARELISAIPDNILTGPQLDRRDILQLTRLNEVAWGQQVYAVPLGSPQLTLYYRSDLFKQLDLQPPTNWREYGELAVRLSQRDQLGEMAPPPGEPWYGTIEPLAEHWAGQVLLARAATYARERGRYSTLFNYNTMKPLIDSPPFVRALEELQAAARIGSSDALDWDPHDVRAEFYAGRCAMALSWPSRAGAAGRIESLIGSAAAIAELPGADEVYRDSSNGWEARRFDDPPRVPLLAVAGRLASVAAESQSPRSAMILLLWLSAKERGGEIASYSRATTIFRASQLSTTRDWVEPELLRGAALQYASIVQQTQNQTTWLFSLRIAGRDQYLAALDEAVQRTISGDAEPAAVLRDAAARWEAITESLGRVRQSHSYQRSLGLEP